MSSIVVVTASLSSHPSGRITFRAERDNAHDKHAVEVLDDMSPIGYVSRAYGQNILIRDELITNEWLDVVVTKRFSDMFYELTVKRYISIDEAFPGAF